MSLSLILIGLLTGAVTGVTGASGVLIVVPILTTFFDLPLHVVLGTSLLVDVIASAVVSYSYFRNKHVQVRSIVWLLVGSLLGSQLGSMFVVSISKILIIFLLAAGMFYFGVKILRSGITKGEPRIISLPDNVVEFFQTSQGLIIAGLMIGLAAGIFGAGGGLAIFIVLYSVLRFPLKNAIGTSAFVMLFSAISGVAGYAENGNLDLPLGLTIGISAAVGGAFSSWIGNKIEDKILARIIGAFFIFLAIIMFVLKVILPLIDL